MERAHTIPHRRLDPTAAVVRSAVRAMMPGSSTLPGCGELELDAFVRRLLHEASWPMWLATTASSLAFVLTPPLTVYLPLPSFLLPASLLDRHADRMSGHALYPVRQAAMMVKTVMGMHWGAHPRVREALALPPYPGDPGTWRTH